MSTAPRHRRAAPEANRWRSHPVLATALRLLILAIPVLCGYAASVLGVRLLRTEVAATRWWLVPIGAASLVVCFGVERLTRRLLPLAALLKLSMLFPDRAPNRFRLARGAVSTRLLNQRVAQARTRDAAAVAAAVLELITALTVHDRRTRGHCERVRVFTELLGAQLHLPREARDKLRWASLLHDIGKLQVAPEILNKPAKLNDTEWKLVAQHPAHGEELLGPLIEWLGEWGSAIRQHHEKYDGTGYPDHLAGGDISRAARIVAIADSYEVMTAHRAYKKPMATVVARSELAKCAGTQFDPMYVRAFLSISLPRLLWAMGPGALAMNLPMLRVLAQSTNKGLLAIPQGAVAAGAAAVVLGSATIAPMPSALATVPAATAQPVTGSSAHPSAGARPSTRSSGSRAPDGRLVLAPQPARTTADPAGTEDPSGRVDATDGSAIAPSDPAESGGPSGAADPSGSADSSDPSDPSGPVAATPDDPGGATGSSPSPTPSAPAPSTSATTTAAAPGPTSSSPSMAAPTLLSTPASSGLLPNFTFTWVKVTGLAYEYQLDGGSWTVIGATNSYSGLALTGTHTFRLRARAGSGGPTPTTSYTFTVLL